MTDENQWTDRPISRAGIAGLLACGLFTTIGLFSPGLVLPQLARDFSGTPNVELLTELVATSASFAFALGAPLSGALISQLGCRRVVVPALVLFAIAGTAPAVMNNLWLILASRLCLGVALAAIFTGALTGIGAQPVALRMRLFGWFSVVGGAAAILLFPLVGELGKLGWRPAFLVNLSALPVALLVLLLPRSLGIAQASTKEQESLSSGSQHSLLSPAMIGLLIIAAMTGMGMLLGPVYGPIYFSTLGVTDTRLLAIPVTLGAIAAVVSSAFYGRVHAKLGINGVFIMTMVVTGCAIIAAGNAPNVPLFTVAIVVQSAMTAIAAPNVSAAALAFSGPGKGSQAIGLANGVMFGSQLLFPLLTAWLRDGFGLSGVFIIFGSSMLLIGLTIVLLRFSRRRAAIA